MVTLLKESLNSDGQQFHQYQQNNNHLSSELTEHTIWKESLNSDDQQFHQYQQMFLCLNTTLSQNCNGGE